MKGKWHKKLGELTGKLGKLRYPLLILLLGVILLVLPAGKSETQTERTAEETAAPNGGEPLSIEESRLSLLLSQVQGAGKVEVMLSVCAGSETIFQSDLTQEQGTGQDERQENTTVLYSDGSGREGALIRQQTAPIYQGAVVLCQGADDPGVKLALVQAVANLTGLGTDRITVIKMK